MDSRQLGTYRILEKIGAGGMGEVYLAEDTRLGRKVAIKVLPEAFATDVERLGRLRREAQLLAQLSHQNIAQLHGLEEHDGTWFLVMELAPGAPLTDYCDQHRLTTKQRLDLFRQVCEGVQHAHQKGIIHRDLKPSNVLVTEAEGKPAPKIQETSSATWSTSLCWPARPPHGPQIRPQIR